VLFAALLLEEIVPMMIPMLIGRNLI